MQVLFKPTVSSNSFSASSTPAPDELPSETADSRDAATSPSPSLPPQGQSYHEIPSPARTSPTVELPDGIQELLETTNSHDAAPSPSPSFPPQGSSHPQIATASAPTPVLAAPPKPFWKHFPILNRSAASVDSKRWKFPRIGNIAYATPSLYEHGLNLISRQCKRRNAGSDDSQHY
jgi:hypothetical protein